MSGFRSAIIIIIGIFLTYLYLNKIIKFRIRYVVIFSVLIIIFITFLEVMPIPVQRAFSWIPFLNVSPEAKTLADASNSAGYWKARNYHVAIAGPTDAVRLVKEGGTNPIDWESGEEADWYVVLASKAPIELVAAPAGGGDD